MLQWKNIGELTLTTHWDKTAYYFLSFHSMRSFHILQYYHYLMQCLFFKKHQHLWVFCGKAVLCKAEVKHRMWRNGKTLFNHTLLTHQDEPQMSSYRHMLLQTLFIYPNEPTTSLCRQKYIRPQPLIFLTYKLSC